MNDDLRPLTLSAPTSRVRISRGVYELLELPQGVQETEAVGYFRSSGELLVCPLKGSEIAREIGERLRAGSQEIIEPPIHGALRVPSAKALVTRTRVFSFPCTWTPNGKQLDLNLGKAPLELMGMPETGKFKLHPFVWNGVLVLMMDTTYQRMWAEDVYEDLMTLSEE